MNIWCDNEEFCVTQDLTFYKLTHPSEFIGNRQMFRVRGISHDEKVENLRSLLESKWQKVVSMCDQNRISLRDLWILSGEA